MEAFIFSILCPIFFRVSVSPLPLVWARLYCTALLGLPLLFSPTGLTSQSFLIYPSFVIYISCPNYIDMLSSIFVFWSISRYQSTASLWLFEVFYFHLLEHVALSPVERSSRPYIGIVGTHINYKLRSLFCAKLFYKKLIFWRNSGTICTAHEPTLYDSSWM